MQLVLQTFLRLEQQAAAAPEVSGRRPALQARVSAKAQRGGDQRATPMQRMQACRDSLCRLDELGWNRSYHQRLFHDDFLVGSCTHATRSNPQHGNTSSFHFKTCVFIH